MPTKYIVPPWTKHTEWHWSKWIEQDGEDHQLHYWPTKRKFRWRGKTHVGNVEAFIGTLIDEPASGHDGSGQTASRSEPNDRRIGAQSRRHHDPIR